MDDDFDLQRESNANRLDALLNGDNFFDAISDSLLASPADIINMILKFSLAFRLPQVAVSFLFEMLNRIFGSRVFPDTRYLVDVLFNPRNNVTFYVICSKRNSYIGRLKEKETSAFCAKCNESTEITKSECENFFITIDPKNNIKT